jgi:hypothetical protein
MNHAASMIAICVVMLSACGSSTPIPTATPEEGAWYSCTLFIQQQVGLSTNDAQRYTPSRVTTLADDQYRVEVFYADQGDTYRCELLRHTNGDMELLSLEVQ